MCRLLICIPVKVANRSTAIISWSSATLEGNQANSNVSKCSMCFFGVRLNVLKQIWQDFFTFLYVSLVPRLLHRNKRDDAKTAVTFLPDAASNAFTISSTE
jgi:hypothetical protein